MRALFASPVGKRGLLDSNGRGAGRTTDLASPAHVHTRAHTTTTTTRGQGLLPGRMADEANEDDFEGRARPAYSVTDMSVSANDENELATIRVRTMYG